MSLKIGRIDYLNCVPYFHFLDAAGYCGEIVSGVPVALNRMLAAGEIDACPSSSFEYGLHPDNYLLLPGHSISSIGPVQSVLLFHDPGRSRLGDTKISLTGESATSVNLLKVLLKEFCGVARVECDVPARPIEEIVVERGSALLIGDRALRTARNCPVGMQIIDLGSLWYHFTGLPFVFALWILRRDSARRAPGEVSRLASALKASKERALGALEPIAQQLAGHSGFTNEDLVRYWQSMSYDLTEGHLEGLKLYFTLCHKYELLDDVPVFSFFEQA